MNWLFGRCNDHNKKTENTFIQHEKAIIDLQNQLETLRKENNSLWDLVKAHEMYLRFMDIKPDVKPINKKPGRPRKVKE